MPRGHFKREYVERTCIYCKRKIVVCKINLSQFKGICEKCKDKRYAMRWLIENREKHNSYSRQYDKANPDKRLARDKRYIEKHGELVQARKNLWFTYNITKRPRLSTVLNNERKLLELRRQNEIQKMSSLQ